MTSVNTRFSRALAALCAVAAIAIAAPAVADETPITNISVANQNRSGVVLTAASGIWLHATGHPGQLLVSPPATSGSGNNLVKNRWYYVAATGMPTMQWQYDHQAAANAPWVFFDTAASRKRRHR